MTTKQHHCCQRWRQHVVGSQAAVSKQEASNRLVVQDEHDAPKTIYRRTNEDTIESIEVHVFTAYIGLVFRCEGINEKDIVYHMFFLLEMIQYVTVQIMN